MLNLMSFPLDDTASLLREMVFQRTAFAKPSTTLSGTWRVLLLSLSFAHMSPLAIGTVSCNGFSVCLHIQTILAHRVLELGKKVSLPQHILLLSIGIIS